MATSKDKVQASFVHFSDFHLGKNFSDKGSPARANFTQSMAKIFESIKSKFSPPLKPIKANIRPQNHSNEVLEALVSFFQGVNGPNKVPLNELDAYFLTGDIISQPRSTEQLDRFHYPFFVGDDGVKEDGNDFDCNAKRLGLWIPQEKLFAITGNHERLMSITNTGFKESQFSNLLRDREFLPSESRFKEKTDYIVGIVCEGRPFLIIGMDSNCYLDIELGSGEILDSQKSWLKRVLLDIERHGIDINGKKFQLNETIKILLLHHSPVESAYSGFANQYVKLKDGYEFIQYCKDLKINIICCGHLHYFSEYQCDGGEGPLILMAGTATELQAKKGKGGNTFNVYQFLSSHKLNRIVYIYNKKEGKFIFHKSDEYNVPDYNQK